MLQVTGTLGTVAIEGEYAIRQFLRPGDQAVILQDGSTAPSLGLLPSAFFYITPQYQGGVPVRFSAEWRGIWARGRHESEWCKTPGGRGMELSGNFEVLLWRRSGDHMRYVIQLVCWLLRFMDKSSEDRVDAYSAQSAFFIIMGFIPFVMLLLILLQYTPMTKEDVMTLLKVIFPEGFHAYLETLVGSVYTKSTALLSGTVITAVWACSKAMMSVSKGLNKIYDTKIRKNYFLARFRAVLLYYFAADIADSGDGAVCDSAILAA